MTTDPTRLEIQITRTNGWDSDFPAEQLAMWISEENPDSLFVMASDAPADAYICFQVNREQARQMVATLTAFIQGS